MKATKTFTVAVGRNDPLSSTLCYFQVAISRQQAKERRTRRGWGEEKVGEGGVR